MSDRCKCERPLLELILDHLQKMGCAFALSHPKLGCHYHGEPPALLQLAAALACRHAVQTGGRVQITTEVDLDPAPGEGESCYADALLTALQGDEPAHVIWAEEGPDDDDDDDDGEVDPEARFELTELAKSMPVLLA